MSIAALGAIESLLCGAVAGNMTGIRLNNNLELIAQGVGNIVIPFSAASLRPPLSPAPASTSKAAASHALSRSCTAFSCCSPRSSSRTSLGACPLAALSGVLIVTAWRMNEWQTIHFYFSHRLKHAIIVSMRGETARPFKQMWLCHFA